MWEIFQKGGIMMWPILFSSIIALAIIIERFIVVVRFRIPSKQVLMNLCDLVDMGRRDELENELNSEKTAIHSVLRAVYKAEGDERAHEKAAELCGDAILTKLNKRMEWLTILGSIVPLMGLLGTVLGMIKVFSKVADAGDISDLSLLAGGIWEALITTAAGMAVAIPMLLAYYALNGKIEKLGYFMAHNAEYFLCALKRNGYVK